MSLWLAQLLDRNNCKKPPEMGAIRNSIDARINEYVPGIAYDISVPIAEIPYFVETIEPTILAKFPVARLVAFGHLAYSQVSRHHAPLLQSMVSGGIRSLSSA